MKTLDSNRHNGSSPERERRAALGVRKRNVLRIGFGLVMVLLLFSTMMGYRIQASLSAETAQIYHRQLLQADLLSQLRRTVLLGSNAARDFLLNPHSDRLLTFQDQFRGRRETTLGLLRQLEGMEVPGEVLTGLRSRIDEFWATLARTPQTVAPMNAAERYAFVQEEIVPRRNAIGDLVREFTAVSDKALRESEQELALTRREAANRLLVTLVLSLVLALAVAGYSLVHADNLEKKMARQYEEVVHAKADLQQLSARLMEIQEEERTRLSRELHDEIGQALATLRLEVARAEAMPPERMPEVRQRLAAARVLAEKTIQTVRNTSLLLRPSLLDDLGLGPALQWLAEDFGRRTGVPCRFSENGLIEDVLPPAVRTCVYRVLQEALHNCEKHAGASAVGVQVDSAAGALTVLIEDNGRGFDPSQSGGPARFGILGMRERAATLGGALEIDSSPGRGTRLSLRLPLVAAAAAAAGAGS